MDRPPSGCLFALLTGGLLGSRRKREESHAPSQSAPDSDARAPRSPEGREPSEELSESTSSNGIEVSMTAETISSDESVPGDAPVSCDEPEPSELSASEPEHQEPNPSTDRPAGTIVARAPLDLASDVAISLDGVVYVARLSAGVARAELPEFSFVPIAVDGSATSVAFGPFGAAAYVAGLGGPLAMVDVSTDAIIAIVGAGTVVGTPLACAVSADGGTVMLGVGGAVYTIDVATSDVSPSIAIPGGVDHLSAHPAAPLFYATASAVGQVAEVSSETRTVVRTFLLGGTPRGSVVSLDGRTLFVANDDGHVDIVSLESAAVVRVALETRGAHGIAMSPDGSQLYVTSSWSGMVHIVDVASCTPLGAVPVGGEPRGIAVSRDGRTIVVANESGWVDFLQ